MNDQNKPNDSEQVALKLIDAQTPGYEAEFSPEEAEFVGAFVEDALSESDAKKSSLDMEITHE